MHRRLLAVAFSIALAIACGSSSSDAPPGGCDTATAKACGGLKCDATLGCVFCNTDGDCRDGPAARAEFPFCVRGTCTNCRSSADCKDPAKPSCWPGELYCRQPCDANPSPCDTCSVGKMAHTTGTIFAPALRPTRTASTPVANA